MMRNFFVLALIVGVSFAAKLTTDKKKTTTNVRSFFHDYDDHHQGGGIPPVLAPNAQDEQCRYWCPTEDGKFYCCEDIRQAESPVLEKTNLYCPRVRPHCPVGLRRGPKICSNDGSCSSNNKCCYDKCLKKSVCKLASLTNPNYGNQQQSSFNPGFQGGFQQQNPGFQGGFPQQNPGFQGGFQQQPFQGGFQQQQPFQNSGFQQQTPGFQNQYQQPQHGQSNHGHSNFGQYARRGAGAGAGK